MDNYPTCGWYRAHPECDHPGYIHSTTYKQVLDALDHGADVYDRDGDRIVSVGIVGEEATEVRYTSKSDGGEYQYGLNEEDDDLGAGYFLIPAFDPPSDDEIAEALASIAKSARKEDT